MESYMRKLLNEGSASKGDIESVMLNLLRTGQDSDTVNEYLHNAGSDAMYHDGKFYDEDNILMGSVVGVDIDDDEITGVRIEPRNKKISDAMLNLLRTGQDSDTVNEYLHNAGSDAMYRDGKFYDEDGGSAGNTYDGSAKWVGTINVADEWEMLVKRFNEKNLKNFTNEIKRESSSIDLDEDEISKLDAILKNLELQDNLEDLEEAWDDMLDWLD